MSRRLFVIGLDGAGPDPLFRWAVAGRLPCLGRLLSNAAVGPLRSTIPPLTGPAWASFQTGVNPGKHGVFGWVKRSADGYGVDVVSGRDIGYPTIGEVAGRHGRRSICIGLPMSYPPRRVNGLVIPGMLTPDDASAPTHPPELAAALKVFAPGYRYFPECSHRLSVRGKVAALREAVRGRAAAARYLMRREAWDLFVLQFQATDKVQHDFWGRTQGEPALRVFQEVDAQLEPLVAMARERDATVVVMSDHGMGSHRSVFSVNTWLLNEGYLHLRRGVHQRLKRVAFAAGVSQRRLSRLGMLLYPLAYRLGVAGSFFDAVGDTPLARMIRLFFLSMDDVDWSRTRAYSLSDIGHIRLNRRGREPQGIVPADAADGLIDELIDGLADVRNPVTDEPLLGDIYRGEEVYHGEQTVNAPDIVLLPDGLRTTAVGSSGFYSNRVFDRPLLPGAHRMEGVVIASGDPFQGGHAIDSARLVDLPANLLYLLGCPIPTYMDGALWEEAFVLGTFERTPPRWEDAPDLQRADRTPQPGNDELLRRRLRSLGYLN